MAKGPGRYRRFVDRQLAQADISMSAGSFIRVTFIFGFFLGFGVAFVGYAFFNFTYLWSLGTWFISFMGFFVFTNGIIAMMADRKAEFIEKVFPDALQLMSANIRSGLTPDRALLLAARPEFGALETEIKRAAKEALTGKPLEEAMMEIPKRMGSKIVIRTIRLINEGLRSGGELASLLDETANDLRQVQSIKKEIKTNVTQYIIFLIFAASIGAPLLYAVSNTLVETIAKIGLQAPSPDISSNLPSSNIGIIANIGVPKISTEFLFYFSIAALSITCGFGGLIIGMIETGKPRSGIRFSFLLIVVAILVFLLVKYFLIQAFGAFSG